MWYWSKTRHGQDTVIIALCVCFSYWWTNVISSSCIFFQSGASDKCKAENSFNVVQNIISKPSKDVRITLPGLWTEITWTCGGTKERVAWSKPANQLRVNYLENGTILWEVYKCDNQGSAIADDNCVVPESTALCLNVTGSSPACVYKLVSASAPHNLKAEVEKDLRTNITKFVGEIPAPTSGVSDAKVVTYLSMLYLVIPAGFSCCSHTNATSLRDSFGHWFWSCPETAFKQTKGQFNNELCGISLAKCPPAPNFVCKSGSNDIASTTMIPETTTGVKPTNCAKHCQAENVIKLFSLTTILFYIVLQ